MLPTTAIMERDFLVFHDENQDRDTAVADAVVEGLETRGLRGYLASRDGPLGKSAFRALEEAFQNTPVFIILFSEPALQSDYFKGVLVEGVLETLLNKNVKILPIFIDLQPNKRPAVLTSIMGLKYEDCQVFWSRLFKAVQRSSSEYMYM